MLICSKCQSANPEAARYCMSCGQPLPLKQDVSGDKQFTLAGMNPFMLSLLGSLALSMLLIFVFRLPVFFLAAFLPLFWFRKKSG